MNKPNHHIPYHEKQEIMKFCIKPGKVSKENFIEFFNSINNYYHICTGEYLIFQIGKVIDDETVEIVLERDLITSLSIFN